MCVCVYSFESRHHNFIFLMCTCVYTKKCDNKDYLISFIRKKMQHCNNLSAENKHLDIITWPFLSITINSTEVWFN